MYTSRAVRTRLRKTALTPRLVGLVTFSFSLLGLGVASYAATLPSLVEIAERVESGGRFQAVATGWLSVSIGSKGSGGSDEDSSKDAGDDTKQDGDAGKDASTSKSPLGGASFSGIKTPAGTIGGDAGDGEPSEGSSGSGGDAASSGASGGSNSGGTGNGGMANGGGSGDGAGSVPDEPSVPETPTEPPVTEEKEQEVYSALYAKASLIDGYVSRINAAIQSFNSDCLASQDLRRQRYVEVDGLMNAALGEYLAVRDGIDVPNASRCKDAQGDLINMYRLLTEYCATLREAWGINKELADPAANVDAFMAPIRAEEVNGVNRQLAEFQQVYGRFSL